MLKKNLNSKKYKRKKPVIENNFFEGLIEDNENLEELIYLMKMEKMIKLSSQKRKMNNPFDSY